MKAIKANIFRGVALSLLSLLLASCSGNDDPVLEEKKAVPLEVVSAQGKTVAVYDFDGFSPLLDRYNDTLYIYNFWATWCSPCVKELPYFNMADSAWAGMPVKFLLISLDFSENIEDVLIPFMIEHELRPEVIVLDDPDANSWIPEIDPSWEGAIPATLFFRMKQRKFVNQSFTFEELNTEIETFFNP